jgi:hypothetical protein
MENRPKSRFFDRFRQISGKSLEKNTTVVKNLLKKSGLTKFYFARQTLNLHIYT